MSGTDRRVTDGGADSGTAEPRPRTPAEGVALRSPAAGYVLALTATGVAALATLLAGPRHVNSGLLALGLAVFVTAGWGGFGPGLFAALLASAAAELSFPAAAPAQLAIRAGLLVLAALLGGVAPAWARPARRRAESHARELRRLNEALVRQKVELVVQADRLRDKAAELETSNRELAEAAREAGEARRAAEQAGVEARRSAALLDAFIDNAPVGFAFWDRQLRYVRANQALAESLGVSREDLLGSPVGSVVPETVAPVRPLLTEVIRARRPLLDVEISGPAAEPLGQQRWRASFFPLESAGEVLGAIGIVADITERYALEEQLRAAQKLEAVARVAGGIAHDFDSLLAAIGGQADSLLESMSADSPARSGAQEIRRAAGRGSSLSRQLLAFSRKQQLDLRVLDLNAVIAGMERTLERMVGTSIALDTAPAPSVDPIRADRTQLEEVVRNLVANACEAMPSGGTLRIATANVHLDAEYAGRHVGMRPGYYVLLSVTDTGIGMDTDVLERIFEPFFSTRNGGSGLGLPTVYGIVRQSGGALTVDSGPGQGTTFRLYFPSIAAHEDVAEAGSAPDDPARGDVARSHMQILLVEDDAGVRAVARRTLERGGYSVTEARDGRAAMQLVEEGAATPDLLVTDLVMPGMSGYELAERLRRRRPRLRILYTSGYAEESLNGHGGPAPEAAFLDKPFTPDALLRKVIQTLEAVP